MTTTTHQQLVKEIRALYEKSKAKDYKAIPFYRVEQYWQIGQLLCTHFDKMITDLQALKIALKKLVKEEKALPPLNQLLGMSQLYAYFPQLSQLSPLLSWSHYFLLIQMNDPNSRAYYHQEAVKERWTFMELKNAITNHQFSRLINMPKTTFARSAHLKNYFQFSFLKQFLGQKIPERDLEQGLIEQLQQFLTELGKGFAFVSQQKRLLTPNGKQLFVDLLFYNYLLNCFVLIDLKVVPLNYEHIGQMDTYIRLFDETYPFPDKQHCIGIILCPKIDRSLLHYSALKDHPRLMAFEYSMEVPNAEILAQRTKKANWEESLFKKTQTLKG